MYYYTEIKYENGEYKVYFIEEPDWEITIIPIYIWPCHAEEVSFVLDIFDQIACGIKVQDLSTVRPLFEKLISGLLEAYLMR